jgi:uncharacterized protein YoxC
MEGIEEQLQRVEEKIEHLLKQHRNTQKEVERLQKENKRLQDDLHQKTVQANTLHQKVDSLNINFLRVNDASKKDLEIRINNYLKEIDKCLSLLNT